MLDVRNDCVRLIEGYPHQATAISNQSQVATSAAAFSDYLMFFEAVHDAIICGWCLPRHQATINAKRSLHSQKHRHLHQKYHPRHWAISIPTWPCEKHCRVNGSQNQYKTSKQQSIKNPCDKQWAGRRQQHASLMAYESSKHARGGSEDGGLALPRGQRGQETCCLY